MSTERFFRLRGRHTAYALLLITAAGTGALVAAFKVPMTGAELRLFSALCGMGIAEAELARRIERIRLRPDRSVYTNLTSVWTFPAALLLSPTLMAIVVAVLHWHLYLRGWYRLKRVPPLRIMAMSSVLTLACYAAHLTFVAIGSTDFQEAVAAGWVGVAAIAAASCVFFVVNAGLIIPALYATGRGIRDLITGWPIAALLEFATLILGAFLAVILVVLPGLAVLIILPAFLLHRAALVEQFESAAQQDSKTGVLNMAGWHRTASRELARNGAPFGVLMIDLDHFKRVNDSYGHLAGDAVLKAVAGTITAAVRREDVVGRFGGEEFVVLVRDMPTGDICKIAERIRTEITRLAIPVPDAERRVDMLSASIGIAVSSDAGAAIEQLLLAADHAVYRAKARGRNRVEGPD